MVKFDSRWMSTDYWWFTRLEIWVGRILTTMGNKKSNKLLNGSVYQIDSIKDRFQQETPCTYLRCQWLQRQLIGHFQINQGEEGKETFPKRIGSKGSQQKTNSPRFENESTEEILWII